MEAGSSIETSLNCFAERPSKTSSLSSTRKDSEVRGFNGRSAPSEYTDGEEGYPITATSTR